MAYQPKSYRKFVATAATATMVASAVTPAFAASNDFTDVSDRYKEAVDYLVKNDITKGFPDGKFGVDLQIKRVDAAVMLAKALELNTAKAPDAGFTDVPARAQGAVNALKEAGIISGKTDTRFGSADELTRGEMAIIIARAYKLTEKAEVKFTDVSDRYADSVAKLVAARITQGKTDTQFGTADPIKRGEFAIFVFKAENPVAPETPGITDVKAINDTTVSVNFGKEIDKDFIREAEQDGRYFAIYKEGETIRGTVINSTSVSFSADGKSAEFVLNGTIQSGEKYHVALLDGPNASVANVVHTYGPTVLRAAASQPDFEVSAVSDKITLKFSTKMKNSALAVNNYEVYDNGGKLIGKLSDFVTTAAGENGDWVNAITKQEVEFTLNPEATQKLLAGKTYKIKLTTNLETNDNKTLSKDNLVISVKTPTVDEAAPKVSTARVTDPDKIVLVFDKDVEGLNLDNLNNLVEIKTATGKKVVTTGITGAVTEDNPDLAPNEVELTLEVPAYTGDGVDPNKLDPGTTYNVEIPANVVTNAVFPNATNKATSSIKATAQDSKAITSVTAKLVSDAKDRTKGNLVLTFDQRPTLQSVKDALTAGEIKIFDGPDAYQSQAAAATTVKYVGGDTTGKSVVIEGVNAAGAFVFKGDDFAPLSGDTYTVEIAAGAIEVDGFGSTNPSNQSKLKASINGVSVSAPVVDRVTLESADKMVVEFKEAIDSTVDLNKITVAGYEASQNKFYTAKDLTGSGNFSAAVSGNKLTLTAKSGVKFATGADGNGATVGANLISFAEHAVVSKDSAISIQPKAIAEGTATDGKLGDVKFVDNAAPVLLYAKEGTDTTKDLLFTFSENIKVEGDVAPQFRTGGDAAKSSVGLSTDATTDNTLNVTFTDVWNDADTTLLEVTAEYRAGQTIYIADAFGNKVVTTKVTGVEKK